jgi:BlaI family transcriptional regulator, penicillinase repressor
VSQLAAISETERDVLKTLWELGQATVRDLHQSFLDRGWAYTTVQTLLNRLVTKGYVVSAVGRGAHIYTAKVSRAELLQKQLSNLADNYCEGTTSPLVLALVEGASFSPSDIAHFRQLLDKLESENSQLDPQGGSTP